MLYSSGVASASLADRSFGIQQDLQRESVELTLAHRVYSELYSHAPVLEGEEHRSERRRSLFALSALAPGLPGRHTNIDRNPREGGALPLVSQREREEGPPVRKGRKAARVTPEFKC